MSQDESQLNLLGIFHYVLAAGAALFSSVFLFHFVWGFSMTRGEPFFGAPKGAHPPPPEFGVMLMLMRPSVKQLFGVEASSSSVQTGEAQFR